MRHGSKETGNAGNSYIAWSLYTGAEGTSPLWKGSRWVTGKWNGATIDGIETEINERVSAFLATFAQARDKLPAVQDGEVRYFVVPEFFFHCAYGPYPYVKLGGAYPFERILCSITAGLKSIVWQPNEVWIICIGSVMTCSIPDIKEFLSRPGVVERQAALNVLIRQLPSDPASLLENRSHIRARGYFRDAPRGDVQQEIDALMKQYRENPLCTVRNRTAVLKVSASSIDCALIEKQNESTVDLTMGVHNGNEISHGGMITEWVSGYPSISIIDGDKNLPNVNPMGARVTVDDPLFGSLELGTEICLDHRLKRLRRTAAMTQQHGALADNPPFAVQIVPSGGMQILEESVSAGVGGATFNADGCDPILSEYSSSGKQIITGSGTYKGIACGVYVSCAQTMVTLTQSYYSHSQLCFRFGEAEIDGYDNARGNTNDNGATYDEGTKSNPLLDAYAPPMIIPVSPGGAGLFAAGFGEMHIYRPQSR